MAGKGIRKPIDIHAGQAPEDIAPVTPAVPAPAPSTEDQRESTVRVTVDFRKYSELRELRSVSEEMAEQTDRTSVPVSAIVRALVNLTLTDTELRDRVVTELRENGPTYFRQYGNK